MQIKFLISDEKEYSLDYIENNFKLTKKQFIYFTDLQNFYNVLNQLNFFDETLDYIILDFKLEKNEFITFNTNFKKIISKLNDNIYFLINNTQKNLIEFLKLEFNDSIINLPKFTNVARTKYLYSYLKENDLTNKYSFNLKNNLLKILPTDFISFRTELSKLNLIDEKFISEDKLINVIYNDENENLFYLIEKIALKEKLYVLNYLYKNRSDLFISKIIPLLANYIYKLIMYKVLSKQDKNSISSYFSNQWEIKKLNDIQKIYNIFDLRKLNKELLLIDYQYKNGIISNLFDAFIFLILKL